MKEEMAAKFLQWWEEHVRGEALRSCLDHSDPCNLENAKTLFADCFLAGAEAIGDYLHKKFAEE